MKNEKKIKVLVADNSEFARNNLKKFLENNEKIQLLNIADNEMCIRDSYKRPKKIIFADVPRNATGKIEKPALRKKYGAEYLVAQQNRA